MIDFRYHLVSIISIFLALAVGIVLGAGPLQDDLGSTLNRQLSDLRAEKEGLRADLDEAVVARGAAEGFANEVAPRVLDGRLRGHAVVIITLDGTPEGFTDDVIEDLSLTGATLTGVVRLGQDWTDPARATHGPTLPAAAPSRSGGAATGWDDIAGQLLATAFVTPSAPGSQGVDPQAVEPTPSALQAQTRLADAGLLEMSTSPMGPADTVVLLGGAVEPASTGPVDPPGSATVASILRDHARAVVAASPARARSAAGETLPRDLVAVIREDTAAARAVSTVDHADSVSGTAVLVLSLAEQVEGGVGHYGYSAGATAPVPDVG